MKASFFTESILYWLAKTLSAVVRRVPPAAAAVVGAGLGKAAYYGIPSRKATAMGNLKAAFGDQYTPGEYRKILRGLFEHLGMTLMEVARIPSMNRAYVDRWVQVAPESQERLEAALAKGRGVTFLTAHFGNWELIPITSALHGYPALALVREQGWPRLNRLLNSYRESKGCKVVTKGFPIRELIEGLKEGKVMGILNDQDAGRHGVLAPFFGRLASTAPGIITLSLKAGAPILPVFMVRRQGAAHTIVIEEPLVIPEKGSLEERVHAGVAAYMEGVERYVRRYPAQWLWLHRRWKTSPERRILIFHDGKAGHLSQAKALAQRLQAAWEERLKQDPRLEEIQRPWVRVETVTIAFRHPALRSLVNLAASVLPKRFSGGEILLRWALTPESYRALSGRSADWSISCGAATAGLNLLWAGSVGARPIHILFSRWPSWKRFQLSVVPEHDWPLPAGQAGAGRPVPENLLLIDGALVPSWEEDQSLLPGWKEQLRLTKERRIGLLLGGPARGIRFDPLETQQLVENLLETARRLDAELLVTSSRRTPPEMEDWLQKRLARESSCRLLALVNRNRPGGLERTAQAVPCILGLSQALVVSGDSISMVSEAVDRRKPVISFLPRTDEKNSKHHQFLEGLSRRGKIRLASPEAVGSTLESALKMPEGSDPSGTQGPDPIVEGLKAWL